MPAQIPDANRIPRATSLVNAALARPSSVVGNRKCFGFILNFDNSQQWTEHLTATEGRLSQRSIADNSIALNYLQRIGFVPYKRIHTQIGFVPPKYLSRFPPDRQKRPPNPKSASQRANA